MATGTGCAVFDYPPGPVTGPGAVSGQQCGLPADVPVTSSCPHGHASRGLMCEGHAAVVAAGDAFCRPCAASGHRCPLAAETRLLEDYWPDGTSRWDAS